MTDSVHFCYFFSSNECFFSFREVVFAIFLLLDLEFGIYRSNTAARLKRMEEEQKRNANTMHIKWEPHAAALSGNVNLWSYLSTFTV